MDDRQKILFVCSGNTCRSPMAEAYFNHEISRRNLSKYYSTSAGVSTVNGLLPSPNSAEVMAENNIDLTTFRSTALTLDLLEDSDWIITMTRSHAFFIKSFAPELSDKVFTLGEFGKNHPNIDIPDPYGGSLTNYRECFAVIKTLTDDLLELLTVDELKKHSK